MRKLLLLLLFLLLLVPFSYRPAQAVFPSQVEYHLSLRNPSPYARDQVVWFDVALHPGDLMNPQNFRVYRIEEGGRREVPSDYLPSTVERYPSSPYIRSMTVVIKDHLEGGEEGSYVLVAGAPSPVRNPSMTAVVTPPMILLRDGEATWQISTTQSLLNTNVYILYTNGSRRAITAPLIPVNGNQLTPDQISFAMLWGEPTYMNVEVRSLLTHITLRYDDAKMVQWGYGATQEQIEHTDIISAELEIYIPAGEAIAYVYATKNLHERIYNHNGFLYEFSTIYGPDDRYECIYGTEDLFRMYGRSSAPTWSKGEVLLEESPPGERASPALIDVDSDGDLDMLVGCSNGTIYLLQNNGTSSSPLFSSPRPYLHYSYSNVSLAVGDMNRDGIPDIVLGEAGGEVYIIYGGMGGIGETIAPVLKVPYEASPGVGDLNGDGILDMVVGDGGRGLYLYWGRVENGIWRGERDDTVFYNLNHGNTKQPAVHPHPTLCDTDGDGDLDLIIGNMDGDFGAITFYYNTGDSKNPIFEDLYPAMFNNVRGGWYVSPTFADLQGDGLPELIYGTEEGSIRIYNNTGNSSAERHVNTMQPLENGSYRFYWDKDGNDGQYVIRGYQDRFDDFYVLATPRGNHATMTYLYNYLKYVHRDRYYGDLYPWAGGNVSYYPFIPEEDGYVTRGILISSVFKTSGGGGMGAGSFISQTGTASGFIQVPLEAREYHTDYAFLPDLNYDMEGESYRHLASLLKNPVEVKGFLNLALDPNSFHIEPKVPSISEPYGIHFRLYNPSSVPTGEVRVRVSLKQSTAAAGEAPLQESMVDLESIPPGEDRWVEVSMPPVNVQVLTQLTVEALPLSGEPETEVEDNTYGTFISFSPQRFTAGETLMASRGPYNSVSPYLVEGEGGDVHLLFSEYTVYDRYDLMDRVIPTDRSVGSRILVVREGGHICVDGSGIYQPGKGLIALFPSNINELNDYLRTRKSIYYWSEKFDLWEARWVGDRWGKLNQVTRAEARNDTDQDPDLFSVGDEIWATFRQTHLDLYKNGHQMDNVPFLDYRILLAKRNETGWSEPVVAFAGEGAGWWRGPQGASIGGSPSCVFESRGGQGNVWDVWFLRSVQGSIVTKKLTDSPMPQIRPEMVSLPGGGAVLWEEKKGEGGYSIFLQLVDNTGDALSQPIPLSEGVEDAIKVRACADGKGGVVAAVYEGEVNGQKDIFLTLFNVKKSLTYGPFRLTATEESEEDPDVLINSRGEIVVGWERTDEDRIRRVYYTVLKGPIRVIEGGGEVEMGSHGEVDVRAEIENDLDEIPVSVEVHGAPLSPLADNITIFEGRHTYMFRLKVNEPLGKGIYPVSLSLHAPNFLVDPGFRFKITVRPPVNSPPQIVRASVPAWALPGEEVNLQILVEDPDGDETFVEWWATSGSFPKGFQGGTVLWKAPGEEGEVTIGVNVSDIWGGEVQKTFHIKVRENSPPRIYYFEIRERLVRAGEPFEVRWSLDDPDGDPTAAELLLPPGIRLLENTTSFALLSADTQGEYTITLRVTDALGATTNDTLTVEILPPIPKPRILLIDLPEGVHPGELFNISIHVDYSGDVEDLEVKLLFLGRWYPALLIKPINDSTTLWSVQLSPPPDISPGSYPLKVKVVTVAGEVDAEETSLSVIEVLEGGGGEAVSEGLQLPYLYVGFSSVAIALFLLGFYLFRMRQIHPPAG